MKKFYISIISVLCLLVGLIVPVLAENTSSEGMEDDNYIDPMAQYLQQLTAAPVSSTPWADQIEAVAVDQSSNYAIRYFEGALIGRYTQTTDVKEGEGTHRTTALTELKLEDYQFGQAKTIVVALNSDVAISISGDCIWGKDCGNRISSGVAEVPGQQAMKKVVHYGWRATSSGDVVQFHVSGN